MELDASTRGYEFTDIIYSFLAANIWIYGAPPILIFGTVGNILSILVMNRKSLRMSTTSLYLTVLAVTDLILLYIGVLPVWLQQLLKVGRTLSRGCTMYLSMVFFIIHFQAWIIVSVSLERLAAVWFPIRHKHLFTRAKAGIGLIFIAIPLIAETSHHYFTLDVSTCLPRDEYLYFLHYVYPWIDITLANILPFLIMLSSAAAIICKLLQRKHNMEKKKFSSMTITLLTVNSVFFITTSPICIVLIIFPIRMQGDTTPGEFHLYVVIRAICNLLYFVNNAINFLLYCLSGRRFRRELLTMIGLKNQISPDDIESTTGQTATNMSLNVDNASG